MNLKQDIMAIMHFEKENQGDSRRKSLICKFSEEIRGDSRRKIKNEEIRGVSRSCGNPGIVESLSYSNFQV